jgi:isopenicillin N synthase-like dioxygenase
MLVLMVDYHSKDAPQRFSESLIHTGFAVLENHPIEIHLIHDAYRQWQEFFLQDISLKNKFLYTKSTQDGYFPFQSENAKDSHIGDLKEFFHIYPWGRIPDHLRDISLELYQKLEKFAAKLLEWIEIFLPENVAKNLSMPLKEMIVKSPNTLLRVLHYPPLQNQVEKGAIRAAPHEDINLITLLPAATAPGLEVLDMQGRWHKVNCDPGNIVVNVGDMLQMCTEYYYKSTTHRVINPELNYNHSRYSMPLFLHPRREVRLSESYTATEYLQQRLREIGAY